MTAKANHLWDPVAENTFDIIIDGNGGKLTVIQP